MNFKLFRRLWFILDPREQRNALIMLFVVIMSALSAAVMVGSFTPFLTVLARPEVINSNSTLKSIYITFGFASEYQFLIALGFISIVIILLSGVIQILRAYVVARFTTMRIHSLSARLLAGFLNQSYESLHVRHSGRLNTQILSETQQAVNGFLRPSAELIASGLTILTVLALLIYLEPVVAITTFAIVSIVYGLIFIFSRNLLKKLGKRRVHANRERFKVVGEALGGIKYLKLAGLEKDFERRFAKPSRAFATSQAIANVLAEFPQYSMQILAFGGGILFCLVLIGPNSFEGGNALRELAPVIGLFAAAAMRILPELGRAYRNLAILQTAAPAVETLCDDLTVNKRPFRPSSENERPLKQTLRLDNVTYQHPGSNAFGVHEISLTIRAGEKIGIVGASGAGKTTLADVCLGLLEPQNGRLLIDDMPVSAENNNVRDWQRSIAYVPQEIFLFDATVAQNIALSLPDDKIDLDRVRRAVELACLSEVVATLPKQFDTMVGERAVLLSGGQRQRLGLARALYADADLLLLDEATSALDTQTEQHVMGRLNNELQHKTIIMIAHRLSTLKYCDRIVVLKDGHLDGFGTWSELSDENREFQSLTHTAGVA